MVKGQGHDVDDSLQPASQTFIQERVHTVDLALINFNRLIINSGHSV